MLNASSFLLCSRRCDSPCQCQTPARPAARRYQLAIEQARATIAAGKPVAKSSGLLDWISSASRWFMVQPNVAGIGINVNAMVDDAVALRRRKRDGQDEPGGQDGG